MDLGDIIQEIRRLGPKRVTITGGEPLLQQEKVNLLAKYLFFQEDCHVNLETSGSIPFSKDTADMYGTIIMDIKPPSTEMEHKNCWDNMEKLRLRDFVKCVIENREDFNWFRNVIVVHPTRANLCIGPRWSELGAYVAPSTITDWLRDAKLWNVRLNLQLHKYIWDNCPPPAVSSLKDVDYTKLTESEK